MTINQTLINELLKETKFITCKIISMKWALFDHFALVQREQTWLLRRHDNQKTFQEISKKHLSVGQSLNQCPILKIILF